MKAIFEAELNFIVPPKANRYLTGKNGKRFIPERIKEKIDDAILILRNLRQVSKVETIRDTVKLEVLFILPDRRKKDLDNMMKTLGDCLEKAQIIENDNLIVRKEVEKAYSKDRQERTIIRIYPYRVKII